MLRSASARGNNSGCLQGSGSNYLTGSRHQGKTDLNPNAGSYPTPSFGRCPKLPSARFSRRRRARPMGNYLGKPNNLRSHWVLLHRPIDTAVRIPTFTNLEFEHFHVPYMGQRTELVLNVFWHELIHTHDGNGILTCSLAAQVERRDIDVGLGQYGA